MVNGLALCRAATVQAQAASMNNPTPVHSEDLQPNKTLNKRRGAGLPPVVSVVGQGRIGLQVARRGGCGGHVHRAWAGHGPAGRGNEQLANTRMFNGQKNQQPHDEASKESDSPSQGRQPHPIPLPPPSSRFSSQHTAQISSASSQHAASDVAHIKPNEEPFSMPLPALKAKTPLSGLPTTLVPRPASQVAEAESQLKECTPSPKR